MLRDGGLKCSGKIFGRGNDYILRGNRRVSQVFVLEKRGTGDSSSLGCLRPEFPTPIVFGGHAEDKRLFAVFCIGLAFVWFVMYKGLHPNWNEWMFVVAMMAIDLCIGR
jgi:hypothetical protein